MTADEIKAATSEALQARFVETGAQFAALANERQAIDDELKARQTRAAAVARLSALSDTEKEALRSVLGPAAEVSA